VIGLVLPFIVLVSLYEERIFFFRNRNIEITTASSINDNHRSAPEPVQDLSRVHRNITLIVQLRGELGNQLSVLANARITQLIAEARYPHIHIQLIGQHQSANKWTKGRDDLVKCFSSTFRTFDFNGGNHDQSGEFQTVKQLQDSWLSTEQQTKLANVKSFEFLDSLLRQQEQHVSGQEQHVSGIPILPSSVSKYSLPYLTASALSWTDIIRNEWYYNDMRQWFTFNMNVCCNPNISSSENDVVFHYRNYVHELKHHAVLAPHFVEMSPYTIANVAFQNYTNLDQLRVAITSRFEVGTDTYIEAFRTRGISSYYVKGQRSGVEGFCYILQTQKETLGSLSSTYYRWAALLGNATLTRFYQIRGSPTATIPVVVNMTERPNATTGSGAVDGTTIPPHVEEEPSAILSIDRFVTGNRTFVMEVYRQLS
jgi:hypothetical protein